MEVIDAEKPLSYNPENIAYSSCKPIEKLAYLLRYINIK